MTARPSRGPSAAVALILLLAIATPASAASPRGVVPRPLHVPEAPAARSYVPGQLVVRFADGSSRLARDHALAVAGARVTRSPHGSGITVVALPPSADVRAAAVLLSHQPGVRFAEPNYVFHTSTTPDDPRLGEMWGLGSSANHGIDAPAAWNVTTGSQAVVVAVVDSGVDYQHPDLVDNIWSNPGETEDGTDNDGNGFIDDVHGWDFVDEDNDPADELGHGTHVAGTIGARGNNGQGISGVAWDVSLMPVRAGNANSELTSADITAAFTYACDMGADIVNASFGGPEHPLAVRNAIEDCPDTLFVVAAGNDGTNNDTDPAYPCAYTAANIVCVAATDRSDRLADFSNFGDTSVDLAAPGVSVLSASRDQVLLGAGFEADLDGFVAFRNSGRFWSQTTEAANSGRGSATDSAGRLYSNSSDTWIETAAPIDLSDGSECRLDYAFQIDFESGDDWFVPAGSTDGGDTWQVIDSGDPDDLVWSGSTDGSWVDWSEDLVADGFDGATEFDLLFKVVTDGSVQRDGVHLDDVALHCLTDAHGTNDFVNLSGTSMATPHVAGVAALMLTAYPDASVARLKAALLEGVDSRSSLAGKVASGGRLNARGALDALDETRPVAKPPSQVLSGGTTAGRSTLPLVVSWPKATDASPSPGVVTYQLQQRTRIGSSWRAWRTVTQTADRSGVQQVDPGTHQFRVRARDYGGNWSAWKSGAQFTLRDPQASPSLRFSGTWHGQTSSVFHDGSTRYATARNAFARHTFDGRQVAWVTTRGPDRGRARVYIDGDFVALVDLYGGSRHDRRLAFTASWATPGTHTIKVVVVSRGSRSSGSRVDVDAFLTLR